MSGYSSSAAWLDAAASQMNHAPVRDSLSVGRVQLYAADDDCPRHAVAPFASCHPAPYNHLRLQCDVKQLQQRATFGVTHVLAPDVTTYGDERYDSVAYGSYPVYTPCRSPPVHGRLDDGRHGDGGDMLQLGHDCSDGEQVDSGVSELSNQQLNNDTGPSVDTIRSVELTFFHTGFAALRCSGCAAVTCTAPHRAAQHRIQCE